ncbi:MAG TPA: vanadium-dependent haloperoxidase [Oligoflexia bacterium]|nr:vanadium-dependent haloperoxidase [Oligoflexia bacterium]HMP49694.1 vanadium-dependent haloperoxidase [Oligoflexia bacterium]
MRKISLNLTLAIIFILSSLASCGGGSGESSGGADFVPTQTSDTRTSWVVKWNRIAIDASGLDHTPVGRSESRVFGEQLGPVRAARAMAIAHIAMADAVAAITGRFDSYMPTQSENPETSLKAAIAQSTHDALVGLFPSQAGIFRRHLVEDLNAIQDGPAKQAGIRVGRERAAAILQERQNDGSFLSEPYSPINYQFRNEPGQWRGDPINPGQNPIGSKWYLVKPFILNNASQFRITPPPAIDSKEYAEAFNEVKEFGGDGLTTPTIRTEDQTIAGIYWAYDGTPSLCAPPRLYNQIAVQLAIERNVDVVDLSRLLVLVNLAMSEEGIASWESKFHYNVWRPVTGIREADPGTGPTGLGDGNPLTTGDANFTPLAAPASNLNARNFTPPFPAYPSGHAGFGATMFQVLRNFFGTDNIQFTFVSDEFNGVTRDVQGNVRPLIPRTFSSLSHAELENGLSRIYLGIHWRFDMTTGIDQGRKVGDYVYSRAYRRR